MYVRALKLHACTADQMRFDMIGSTDCWCSFLSGFEQKTVFKDHHEKNSIWGKDGFYVLVTCLTIFLIIFTCLMVRISQSLLPYAWYSWYMMLCGRIRPSKSMYMHGVEVALMKYFLLSQETKWSLVIISLISEVTPKITS